MNLPTATEKVIEAMVILETMTRPEEADEAYIMLDTAVRYICDSMGLDFTSIAQSFRNRKKQEEGHAIFTK